MTPPNTLLPPAPKLGKGNIFRSVCEEFCSQGVVSQHALQVSKPTPREEVEGSDLGGSPGPHPGEKLRGLAYGGSPGPHPGGKLRGLAREGGLQAYTWGVSRPTPQGVISRPTPQGVISRPTPGGVSQHALRQTPPPPPQADGYCCERYASYWNAFLFWIFGLVPHVTIQFHSPHSHQNTDTIHQMTSSPGQWSS